MKCIDTRPCMYRTVEIKHNNKIIQCGILRGKEYSQDGECPFCKKELKNIGERGRIGEA